MSAKRVAVVVVFAVTATGLLAGKVHAAGMLVADGGLGGVLEVKEHDVNVVINNGVAVTEVDQVFLNTENRVVEALYTFPVNEDEIVRLCEGYSIVSQYASFIVLENDAEYRRWKIDRRNAVRIARDRAARQKVRDELDRLRQQSVAQLGPQPGDQKKPQTSPAAADGTPENRLPTVAQRTGSSARELDSSRGRDITIPGTGGGRGSGAFDPLMGLIAFGLGGAALASHRRKRKK